MKVVYSLFVYILSLGIWVTSLWNKKAKKRQLGLQDWKKKISEHIAPTDTVVWMHASSLGEFEQGKPLLEKIKKESPQHKIVVSFFSPSGFEVRKNYAGADLVFYLPPDTYTNAISLIKLLHPDLVIFVKYEFWYNLMQVLSKKSIPFVYLSAVFRKKQYFFKPWAGWFVRQLHKTTHFFVQDQNSKNLLAGIGIRQATVSGDTRFDSVKEVVATAKKLDFVEEFKNKQLLYIAGSTWPEDEKILANFINTYENGDVKFLIAPHNIEEKQLKKFEKNIKANTMRYTEWVKNPIALQEVKVFILDTVGLLAQAYAYADIAYVGGGFDTDGIHNVLEPAAHGVPVIYGPKKDKYIEAIELAQKGGGVCVASESDFIQHSNKLITHKDERLKKAKAAKDYVWEKPPISSLVYSKIQSYL